MNFLIIGEPCVDEIHKADGETIKSYGGILYSVISMAVLCRKGDTVTPLMNLGEDEYDGILEVFRKFPNIKTEGIKKCSHPTRKVYLHYNLYNSDKTARMENSTEPTYELSFEWIEGFLQSGDAMLINMISGVDISIETLKRIRKYFHKYIHIDIHNIVMETRGDGSRIHKYVDNWLEWCSHTDTLQMNEFEAITILRDKRKEYDIASDILLNTESKVKALMITRGKSGVTAYVTNQKSFRDKTFTDLDRHELNAIENPRFADSTGCGDVFATSFTIEYANSKDIMRSLNFANRKASLNASLEGLDDLVNLK
ncbi:hypothetical protein BH10BAC5_BH10BAC5_15400 [soil metagenome]